MSVSGVGSDPRLAIDDRDPPRIVCGVWNGTDPGRQVATRSIARRPAVEGAEAENPPGLNAPRSSPPPSRSTTPTGS